IPLRIIEQPRLELTRRLSSNVKPLLLPLLEDLLVAKDAIAALRKYSLISRPVRGTVSIHRLVQAVVIDQLPERVAEEWRQAASWLMGSDFTASIRPLVRELDG